MKGMLYLKLSIPIADLYFKDNSSSLLLCYDFSEQIQICTKILFPKSGYLQIDLSAVNMNFYIIR